MYMHSVSINCKNIRVLSSKKQKTLPDKNGIAEVLNSSLYGVDEVTICARFKTYQFKIYLEYEFFPFQDILHYDNIGHLYSSFRFYLVKNPKCKVVVLKITKKIVDPTGSMGVWLDFLESTEKMQPLRKFWMAMCGLQVSGTVYVFWQVLQRCNFRLILMES